MRLIQFGAVTLPVNDANDRISIEARENILALPGGAYDRDGHHYVPLPRSASRSFRVLASDTQTVQEIVDELLKEFSKGRNILKAKTRDGDHRQTWAKVPNAALQWKPGGGAFQEANCIFAIPYPWWLHSDDEPVHLNTGYKFDGTWKLNEGHYETQAITTTSHSFTITNDGGAAVRRGRIAFIPGTGASITAITVRNKTTGKEFTWSSTLSDGERLDFDLLTESVRKDLITDSYAYMSIPSSQNGWMELALGSNAIQIIATSITGSVTMRWKWARHYL